MTLQTKAVSVPIFVENKFKEELSMSDSFTFIHVSYAFQAPSPSTSGAVRPAAETHVSASGSLREDASCVGWFLELPQLLQSHFSLSLQWVELNLCMK